MNNLRRFIKKYFQNFAYFYQRLRYRIFVRMGLSIGVGLLDGFGLAMFLPLLQFVDSSANPSANNLGNLSFLITGMHNLGVDLNLMNVLIVMSLFFLLKGFAQYISLTYEVRLRQFFVRAMLFKLSSLLSQMAYKRFITSDAGRIQNTMTGEVNNVTSAYQNYFATFQQLVMVIVYMLFAFFVDAKFAVLICLGGLVANLAYRSIYKTTKSTSKEIVSISNLYQGLIIQFVANFKYLKATGSIKKYNKKLTDTIYFVQEKMLKIGKLGAIVSASREPILIIIVSTVILIQVVLLHGQLSSILISLLFFYRALSALIQMQSSYNGFLAVSGSLDNVTSFETELNNAIEKEGSHFLPGFNHEVNLQDASFFYSDTRILKNINLSIQKNQTIAFVGESGSGKTTLVNILAGLLPLTTGKMYIDGVDSIELNIESFAQRVGYITQEPVIFNDTIYNNVSFWAEPTTENQKRFQHALQLAFIDRFIDELPLKEDTMLGNNGVNLSGGQKQRISIARELFKQADIIVMDEATSALDSETERSIQKSIENLHGNCTVIVIAHRLSTIKNVDEIYLLDKGQIIANGNFEEMIETSAKFKRMVALQEV